MLTPSRRAGVCHAGRAVPNSPTAPGPLSGVRARSYNAARSSAIELGRLQAKHGKRSGTCRCRSPFVTARTRAYQMIRCALLRLNAANASQNVDGVLRYQI